MNKQGSLLQEAGRLIGSTPLLEIIYEFQGKQNSIFAKAESYNLTGSSKDRVALEILRDAYQNGSITPEYTIAEATSGNTGIAFAALGAMLGNPVRIFMPDFMSVERKQLIRSFHADIVEISREEGAFLGSIARSEQFFHDHKNVFLPRQFSNPLNTRAHYRGTGSEIVRQMADIGKIPDAVVAGVGTGGTVSGIGQKLREVNPHARVFPLEPANFPVLSTGVTVGSHRIAGIGDEFVPQIMKDNPYDGVLSVDDGDAINMARRLSRELGVAVGISSGANLLGAVMLRQQLGAAANIVTVFADDNKKYLSTDYCEEQKIKSSHLSPRITLKGVRAIPARA